MSVFLLMSLYLASYNVAGTAAVPCVGALIALVHGLGNGRQFRWRMQLCACSLKLVVGMASMQSWLPAWVAPYATGSLRGLASLALCLEQFLYGFAALCSCISVTLLS